jgi:hypothetical protein
MVKGIVGGMADTDAPVPPDGGRANSARGPGAGAGEAKGLGFDGDTV